MSWATTFLRWIGIALYLTGLGRVLIWVHRREPKVVAFHASERAESAALQGLDANTTPDQLAAQLSFLRRRYNVVPLSTLEEGTFPERAVVITFDDGYRSFHDVAFPLLKSLGMPATLYVVATTVGNQAMTWVNELNWLLRVHSHAVVPRAARTLCGRDDASPDQIIRCAVLAFDPVAVRSLLADLRSAAGVEAGALASQQRLYVTWDQISEMVRFGVTVGNHTASHPNLTRLDAAAQSKEMAEGQEALRDRPGTTTSLAYPFGLYNDESERAAGSLGCSSVMTIGGVNRPLDLRRVARVPAASGGPARLFAQMEVVEPVKAGVRRWLRRRLPSARERT
jgi:peptidoglycan/xylan/chitin deacetylase (PgdA/CDA1 family)